MKNNLINVLIFAAGAAIGSAVTWKVMKDKYEGYEEYEQEETEEYDEEFVEEETVEEVEQETQPDPEIPMNKYEKPNIFEYASKLEEHGYTNYSGNEKKEEPPVEEVKNDEPYIIEPNEFGEYDYEVHYLTYYAGDKKLADNRGELVDHLEEVIGLGVIEEFEKYDEDVLYVRNDRLMSDYEVYLDEGKYSEIYE